MWINFGGTLVNLDLIKEITPVEKVMLDRYGTDDDHRRFNRYISRNRTREENEEHLRSVIQHMIEDNNRFAGFGWVFDILYLNGERKTITGACEQEIHDARDEFFLLVSDNQPQIPTINVEEVITKHDYLNSVENWNGDLGEW